MYDHILVPISPDEPALSAPAVEFAHRILSDGGRITVLSVLEVPPAYAADYLPEKQAESVAQDQEARLDEELKQYTDANPKVVFGHAARAILDEADEAKTDGTLRGLMVAVTVVDWRPQDRTIPDFVEDNTITIIVATMTSIDCLQFKDLEE